MTQKHKELKEQAWTINNLNQSPFKIEISKRNGFYCVDYYDSNNHYQGLLFAGNFTEVHNFLTGMRYAYFIIKPF